MNGPARPRMALALGATCISFAPVLVKVLVEGGLGPTAVGFWRCLMGTAVLTVLVRVRGRSLRLPRRAALAAACAGLAFFVDLWVWHRSIRDAGAGLATILGNMQVFLTAVLSVWFFGERVGVRFVAASACAIAGVGLLVGIGSDVEWTAPYVRGIGYGLATALAYATFLLAMRVAGREAGKGAALPTMTWMSVFAAVPLGIATLFEPGAGVPAGIAGWAAAAALAVLAHSVGWWSISRALPHVPGAVAGLLLLLQPVLATVWGVALMGERLTSVQLVGAVVTLAAIHAGSRRAAVPGTRSGQ